MPRCEAHRKEELGVLPWWGWREMGRRGTGSVGKQPSSLPADRAAAAAVITNIDVFSTASFQTLSLIYLFLTLPLQREVIFTSGKEKSLAEKRCTTCVEIS